MTRAANLLPLAALAALIACAAPAAAQDRVKVAVGQIDAWANQVPTLGMRAGIFQKHGIVLETFGTQGAGETLQAVIAGSADIGIGVGTPGAMRAFAKGAPIRVIAAAYTGVADQYWYVKPDSPLKSLSDATGKETIAYSTSGSTSHVLALALVNKLGVKAKPVAGGGPTAVYTMTMTGQVDIGWGVVPFGLQEYRDGKFRIIARGNDLPLMRDQTVRVEIANAEMLKTRPDVVRRFMAAYRETLDWMYADPQAVKLYAEAMHMPESLVILQRDEFNPKQALQPDRLSDLDGAMADAVALKFLDAPLTQEQLAEFVRIPAK